MFEIKKYNKIKYIITKPTSYHEDEKYPEIIFMHGAGTRGDDINKLKTNPFYEYSMENINQFMTFAPLCNADTWFDIFEQILEFCEYVSQNKNVDKNRVYLMGASMGGYAVWQIAMSRPELFAAIVPICGGGMYWNALRLKNIPVWAFHGKDDKCVLAEESIKMVESIKNSDGDAKITLYENTGHDAWTETYKNKFVFEWLLSNVKGDDEAIHTNFDDTKTYG